MPRTRTEQLWIAGAAVVALLMALVGYFLLIGPQRSETSAMRAKVSDAAFQETALQSRIVNLSTQSKRISAYRAALARAEQALPASDDLTATPQLLRALATEAKATSTTISDLTVGDPEPVTPTAATPAAAASSPSSSSSASSSSASSTPTAPAAPAASTLSSIALGATVSGSAPNLNRFLTLLQTGQPRALLVTAVTLSAPAEAGGQAAKSTSLTLTMTAFVRPAAGGATPGN